MGIIVNTEKFIRAYNSLEQSQNAEVENALHYLDTYVKEELDRIKPEVTMRIENEIKEKIAVKYNEKRELFEQFIEIKQEVENE